MAIVKGNISTRQGTPGSNIFTKNHTHNSGADVLVVVVANSTSVTDTSVTWGGVAMTRVLTGAGNDSRRVSFYVLSNASTGTQQVKVTYNGSNWNASAIGIHSYTGASGSGVVNKNLVGSTNNTISMNGLTSGSIIIGAITTFNTGTNIQIPTGTNRPIDYNLNINRRFKVATSDNNLATNITMRAQSSWGSSIIFGVEIKEGGGPTRGRRIIIC